MNAPRFFFDKKKWEAWERAHGRAAEEIEADALEWANEADGVEMFLDYTIHDTDFFVDATRDMWAIRDVLREEV